MKFSYDIPNKPGFYWARLNKHELMPVEVVINDPFMINKYILLIGYGGKTFDLFYEQIEIGDEIIFKE